MSSSDQGKRTTTAAGRLRWLGYQAGLALLFVICGPFLLAFRGRHYLPSLPRRLGLGGAQPARGTSGLWIHAVSVGEVDVAVTFARALSEEPPALVTTVTPTGQAQARKKFAETCEVAYLPFDFGVPINRFFRRFGPRALVLAEGDYWPLLLREAKLRGLPVAVINGRMGDKGFGRLRRFRWIVGRRGLRKLFYDGVDLFGVQTEEDARRLVEIGVDPGRVKVTGNLKYEAPVPPPRPEAEEWLARVAAGRPILMAGSTMKREERRVLDAFEALGGGRRALLLLAPRHEPRWDGVAAEIEARELTLARRSLRQETGDVALLDSLGELASLYRYGIAAFIGGTLVREGGHNPVEAARWSVPVAAGPSMENFRQMAQDFDDADAWARVRDAAGLAEVWGHWLDHPEEARAVGGRGRDLVESRQGALARTLEMLAPLLR